MNEGSAAVSTAPFERLPGEPTLEAIGIVKDFATIRANDMVNFAIKQHEIHALLGENGAVNSTLV
jgi:simple sugar transport system ATP-binding protein